MDLPAVEAQLNDLPTTFKRDGAPYTQLIDSVASALALFTNGADATVGETQTFGVAVDGWLDLWGLLFGVPRNQGEGNQVYALRISRTVLAWVGTVPAIQAWLNFYAPGGIVAENGGGALGYTITLPSTMTIAQVQAFILSLNRIRPAGVPFNVFQIGTGMFLGTEVFLGDGRVMGTYLAGGTQSVTLSISSTTNSSQPLLPTLYFADPTINPSLAPPFTG